MYLIILFFFFKQKTAYEMRISDWSSDVCSSDLHALPLNLRDQYPDKRPRACRSDCNGAQADRRCLRALLWRKIIAYRLIEGRVDRTLGKSEQEAHDDEGGNSRNQTC